MSAPNFDALMRIIRQQALVAYVANEVANHAQEVADEAHRALYVAERNRDSLLDAACDNWPDMAEAGARPRATLGDGRAGLDVEVRQEEGGGGRQ